MRPWVPLVLLLLAGCVATPPPEEVDANATTPTAPTSGSGNETTEATPPIGERMDTTMERFVLLENHTLDVLQPDAPEMPAANVAEPLSAIAFWESFATPLTLTPWTAPPFRVPFETTGDIEITIRFSSNAPAIATNPKAAGFPGVGGWLGTVDRFAFFLLAQDAPDSLEAGKVYTVTMKATPPKGGFFARQGDQLALYSFLSYQTADGTPVSYVVGGPDPAGVKLPHAHFNLSAPRATVLLDESGELGPNPGISGDMHNAPVDIALSVPPDALYVVLEVDGAPKAGDRIDIDGGFRTSGGDVITGGSGPNAKEIAVLGPGNLQAYGRDLLAHVTCGACPNGGTYTLKVTAYAP